jgi:hypothetical protein
VRAIGQHHDAGRRVPEVPPQPLDQRGEGRVDEQDPVLGVADDVHDLLVEQPRIHGVDDRTHARDREIELVVAVGVPGERADAVLVTISAAPWWRAAKVSSDEISSGCCCINPSIGDPSHG